MSMQPFEKLSYRGKTRRLRQLAMNALLCYPMEVASVHLIEAFTNANYRVKTRDGDSYFIRVCEPNWRTDLDLISEVAFLQALSRDGNFLTRRCPSQRRPAITSLRPLPRAFLSHVAAWS